MNNWQRLLVIFFTTGLFACASQPEKKPNFDEFFETDIKENDLKIFTYKINIETPTGSRGDMRGMGGGMGRGGGGKGQVGGQKQNVENIKNELKEKTFSQLEAKLAETGFCREGYTTINSYFERSRSEIYGECNEGATEGNREKFTAVKNRTISKTPKEFADIILAPDNPK
ncbi:MAG: hypothetical protein V7725_00645 [Porticoccus sp.]